MKSLFSLDSPFGQKLTLLSNLVLLNLLWILCSIPIVTMGAATAAMYHVIFLYITNQDDAVIKPFFKAFAGSLKQATAVWLLHLLCGGMLVAEAFYLAGGASLGLKLVFLAVVLLFLGVGSYFYHLVGRYQTTGRKALWNSLALALRHPGATLLLALVQAAIGAVLLLSPALAWKSAIFWTLIGFALLAYLFGWVLLRIFVKYDPPTCPETES